ncbi:DUF692 family multinuclear iron-containing protein [Streptomyces sp. NPDC087903]|uniref:multinuclear nonheme iron-dependent oxidase n=1 Tax=Streptomyces sp. NPDC087903 TaxID=3365819 RepID=UPI003815118B
MERLGTGIGWRPEIADAVERMPGIDWVEVVAENTCPGHLPASLVRLRERGVTVVPHGVSLGLGGADRPDAARLTALAERAEALGAPLVTEHIAYVRAGGALTASPLLEAGHLLPVPRTRDALDVLCENVRIAQDALPVPLAVENIAALLAWPGEEMTEGQFLYELADRTGVRLLIDVANLHTNHVNRGEDPAKALAELPLEAIAYVHVAGGFTRDGVWHDSHAHPVPRPVLDILTDLASRVTPPGVLLERDENFPEPAELERELATIGAALVAGREEAEVAGAGREAAGLAVAGRTEASPTGADRTNAHRPGAHQPEADRTGADRPEAGLAGADRLDSGPAEADQPDAGLAGADRLDSGPAEADQPDAGRTEAVGTPSALPGPASPDLAASPHSPARVPASAVTDPARQRLALAQAALLSALVAGTPVPEGFDRVRLGIQARALAAKRADVVAKVAPELPEILGDAYRPAFLAYAHGCPMTGGYRRDALDFVGQLLLAGRPDDPRTRRELRAWWLERSGPAPLSHRPALRLARATRRVLLRR